MNVNVSTTRATSRHAERHTDAESSGASSLNGDFEEEVLAAAVADGVERVRIQNQ